MTTPNFVDFPSTVTSATLTGSNGLQVNVVTGTPNKIITSIDENVLSVSNVNVVANGSLNTLSRNVWNKPQCSKITALGTAGSSLSIDLSLSNDFSLTLGTNLTLAAPTNPAAGQSGAIIITQDGNSAYTISYNSFWKFASGIDKSVSTSLNSLNVLTYYVISPSLAVCNMIKNIV